MSELWICSIGRLPPTCRWWEGAERSFTRQASGTKRPPVEWQTVHWQARRNTGDAQNSGNRTSAEPVSPTAFQLVAFRGPVRDIFRGRTDDTSAVDVRTVDRMCKYPSGELPAAIVEAVAAGGGAQGAGQQSGFVDEIDVTEHFARDLVVDVAFAADSQQMLLKNNAFVEAQGLWYGGGDVTAALPAGGGLLQIDDEILAYSARDAGTVAIAKNGRGLLHTEARAHDRGARVHFLTQRPAAILLSSITGRSDTMPLQALGAMPPNFGTVLINRSEMAHYCWVRASGDNAVLEMPRQFPPGDDGDSTGSRGLFRGRYGTVPTGAGAQEPVILMPFRYWDRHAPRNDDPEQSYFQFTSREAPVYFRSLQWEEEVSDGTVDVVCLVRADERAPWTSEPGKSPFLRQLQRPAAEAAPSVLDVQATQLEIRFAVEYRAGCLDLQSFRAHGWKTAPTIRRVEVESEGEGRIVFERVSAR